MTASDQSFKFWIFANRGKKGGENINPLIFNPLMPGGNKKVVTLT